VRRRTDAIGISGTTFAEARAGGANLARAQTDKAKMSDEIDIHLGKRMRRRRRLLGLTQQQLADSCGVRFQQIQKYECGANRVSAARLWRIAGALDVPVNYFFEGLAQPMSALPDPMVKSPDLLPTFHQLGERPRQRLLGLAHSLGRDTDAA
jgi:transcriptional regulator with XRE-family HTH domain